MSKKSNMLSGAMDSLLSSSESPVKGKKTVPSAEKGAKLGDTRFTFLISKEQLLKVKGIAYFEQHSIKEVMRRALAAEIKKYEKANGEIMLPGSK